MSRPGTPYDNVIIEKFWNDFKIEWWDKKIILTTRDVHKQEMASLRMNTGMKPFMTACTPNSIL